MPDTPRTAFAHPQHRRLGADTPAPRDRISLRDYVVATEIGAFQAERGLSQRLRFNIVVDLNTQSSMGGHDDVDAILSYDKLIDAITAELGAGRKDLLETLADNVAARILAEPQAHTAIVRVEKLDRVPGALGVEIVRTAGAANTTPVDDTAPQPVIVVLPTNAATHPNFTAWVDACAASPTPVILCSGFDDLGAETTREPKSQRRIDLLTIEQNCWRMAAHDARCVVVDSKTELDWGMRHGQISLWAPSRLILNAPDAPSPARGDMVDYTAWFANSLGALRIIVVDQTAPRAVGDVPIQTTRMDQVIL